MKKLIVILFLLVALSGLGAISGGTARPDRTVTIPAGGGAITNIVWQNNTRYVLDAGTNTLSTFQSSLGNSHVFIQDKTNITLEGLGWQSVLFTGQTGTCVTIFNCDGIKFKNFAIIGTRGPETGATFGTQFAAIEERGTNRNLLYEGLLLRNHSDQGISAVVSPPTYYTTNSLITKCWFENIGTTNCDLAGGRDGTAVVMNGSNIRVVDCHFVNNHRDMEPFSDPNLGVGFQQTLYGLKALGNTSVGLKAEFFYGQIGTREIQVSDNTVTFNAALQDGARDLLNGVVLTDCRDVRITGNQFKGGDEGIYISTVLANAEAANYIIADNTITKFIHGTQLTTTVTNAGAIISHNIYSYNLAQAILFNGMGFLIKDNIFNQNASGFGSTPTIQLQNNGGLQGSNIVSGNIFWSDKSQGAVGPDYAIKVSSGANYNLFKDNLIYDYSSGPWLDSGTANIWINNMVGTNLMPYVVYTNQFAGTNIFWNVAAAEDQFTDITNASLLILTNWTTLDSARRFRMTFINNKSTNCNMVVAAGPRILDGGQITALSPLQLDHTNARATLIEGQRIGTNFFIKINRQQN